MGIETRQGAVLGGAILRGTLFWHSLPFANPEHLFWPSYRPEACKGRFRLGMIPAARTPATELAGINQPLRLGHMLFLAETRLMNQNDRCGLPN